MELVMFGSLISFGLSGIIRMLFGVHYFQYKRNSEKFNQFVEEFVKNKGWLKNWLFALNSNIWRKMIVALFWFVNSEFVKEKKIRVLLNTFSGIAITSYVLAFVIWIMI